MLIAVATIKAGSHFFIAILLKVTGSGNNRPFFRNRAAKEVGALKLNLNLLALNP
jgi:hypothetical protein